MDSRNQGSSAYSLPCNVLAQSLAHHLVNWLQWYSNYVFQQTVILQRPFKFHFKPVRWELLPKETWHHFAVEIPGSREEAVQTVTAFSDRRVALTAFGSAAKGFSRWRKKTRKKKRKKKNSDFGAPSAGATSTFTHNCFPFSPTDCSLTHLILCIVDFFKRSYCIA